ncbi:MAG: primosomal protein N' [Gemmatimonadetes bacterium]|nr:primosomal protein N' [Gemmatimonadota bacterium]MYA44326.1 primosomal protein N' [Gemmatimonadota bacterium]MYE94613.1 primosomal protein N' [Gemmatimonadota bacterium]
MADVTPAGRRSLIRVALPVPVRRSFTYSVTGEAPAVGVRVEVPFGKRTLVGWVLGPGSEVPRVREVRSVLDTKPVVGDELLGLARWMSDYYVAPVGIVLKAMLPARMASAAGNRPLPRMRAVVTVVRSIGTLDELEDTFGRARRQREAYEQLQEAGGKRTLAALGESGFSRGVIRGLEAKGLARVTREAVLRDPFGDQPAGDAKTLMPTIAQRGVLERMYAALGDDGGTFLLHGVTSSGKTLVYIELIRRVLERGGGALMLVPEIALTPQTVSRFRGAFGDLVAVLHSGLSAGERYDAWNQLRSGDRRIAIGPRSAVFAPVANIGAIVVDEEHDGSYKQSESPRYHARDVAVVRAARNGALCVLGSATPSLESWLNARSGKYSLLELPDRVGGGVLPDVRVVDLRSRPAPGGGPQVQPGDPPPRTLSPGLTAALRRRLERGEQTILLLNRRGYASFALCEVCGAVGECYQCSVSMTLHRGRGLMICHHCGHTEAPIRECAHCGSRDLSFGGLGTEQVERILLQCFPGARVARMDVDTTRGKWSHRDILDRVRTGKVDILLGTQMIAKGLDFPRVTLVGVINADIGLHLPDFRSCERTFQLLAQVAGRAGRAHLPGEVIVQTYVPDHYVIRAAVAHDYRGFADRELEARRDPPYPPRVRMARILLSSPVQKDALAAAERLGEWLRARRRPWPDVLGPAPAPIEKLHGRFRWHVLLRGNVSEVGRALLAVAEGFRPAGRDVRVSLDRDPQQLM